MFNKSKRNAIHPSIHPFDPAAAVQKDKVPATSFAPGEN